MLKELTDSQKKFFTKHKFDLTEDEFNSAVKGMLEDGLMEEVVEGERILYVFTKLGEKVGLHEISDPKSWS